MRNCLIRNLYRKRLGFTKQCSRLTIFWTRRWNNSRCRRVAENILSSRKASLFRDAFLLPACRKRSFRQAGEFCWVALCLKNSHLWAKFLWINAEEGPWWSPSTPFPLPTGGGFSVYRQTETAVSKRVSRNLSLGGMITCTQPLKAEKFRCKCQKS